jgi:hypothetical protein
MSEKLKNAQSVPWEMGRRMHRGSTVDSALGGGWKEAAASSEASRRP